MGRLSAAPAAGVVDAAASVRLAADPAITVSGWRAEVNPVAAAVIVGVPEVVSLYLKLAVLLPLPIVTDVMVRVSVVSRNTPVPESDVRLTVVDPFVTGLLDAS